MEKYSIQEGNRKTTPVALIFIKVFGFSLDFDSIGGKFILLPFFLKNQTKSLAERVAIQDN